MDASALQCMPCQLVAPVHGEPLSQPEFWVQFAPSVDEYNDARANISEADVDMARAARLAAGGCAACLLVGF